MLLEGRSVEDVAAVGALMMDWRVTRRRSDANVAAVGAFDDGLE